MLVGVNNSNIFIAVIPGLRLTGILLKIHRVINTDLLAASIRNSDGAKIGGCIYGSSSKKDKEESVD